MVPEKDNETKAFLGSSDVITEVDIIVSLENKAGHANVLTMT